MSEDCMNLAADCSSRCAQKQSCDSLKKVCEVQLITLWETKVYWTSKEMDLKHLEI